MESRKTYVNKSREIIYRNNKFSNDSSEILRILSAGVTLPDSKYRINRRRGNEAYDQLYIIEYVVSGKGYIESEGIRRTVSAGDCYIVSRRTVHTYYADSEDPFEKKWLNLSGSYINMMTKAFFIDEPFTVIHLGRRAEKIFDMILERIRDAGPEDTSEMLGYVMKRLLDLFLLIDEVRRSDDKATGIEDRIRNYIDKNICLDISVDMLCAHFHISSSTLYRMFVGKLGMSAKEYIMSKKIECAKRMIISDSEPLNDIASSLGFYDIHHFIKAFRKYTGLNPSDFRKCAIEQEEKNK